MVKRHLIIWTTLRQLQHIFRSDRKQDAENNTHGGAMIAIKNNLASEKIITDQPDCSLTCRLEINNLSCFIPVFYNPPKGSVYRYTQKDFGTLLSALPKNSRSKICGDLNFPNTNWLNFPSEDTDEQEVLELFENNLFIQSVGFNTLKNNTLTLPSIEIVTCTPILTKNSLKHLIAQITRQSVF